MATRRDEACAMFWQLYASARAVTPTTAHRALAAFEEKLPAGTNYLLITQNVDGLHQAAGSKRVCEFHGSLARWRCFACGAELALPDAPTHCGQPMRPSVVLFGEEIPADAEHAAKRALRDCDLFVAIGTSGLVFPAAGLVDTTKQVGGTSWLVNLEPPANVSQFDHVVLGPAARELPSLLA